MTDEKKKTKWSDWLFLGACVLIVVWFILQKTGVL